MQIGSMPALFRLPGPTHPGGGAAGPRGLAFGASKTAFDLRGTLATRSTDTSLRIVTDEGDVVTLSAATTLESFEGAFRYRAKSGGETRGLRGDVRDVGVEQNIRITVEGDLSAEELDDVRALVRRLAPALQGFTPGEGERLALAIDGSAFESLAGFHLSVERSVEVTRFHVKHRAFDRGMPGARVSGGPVTEKLPADRMPVMPYTDEGAAAFIGAADRPAARPVPVEVAGAEPDVGMDGLLDVLIRNAGG